MSDLTLIFPDQLFQNHPAIVSGRPICLAEEFLFYKVQPFHKQRLVMLRAAMRGYSENLMKGRNTVLYIPSKDLNQRGALFDILAKKGIKNIHVAEFADEWLSHDLATASQKYGWKIHFYPSPGFLCSNDQIKAFFGNKEQFSMAQFYAYQRKRLKILMEGEKPLGGKYSFDSDNRKKWPRGMALPATYMPPKNQHVEGVIAEIESEFPEAVGQASPFLYPTTHEEARTSLDLFLKNKLNHFGDYQDAIHSEESVLFHSVLSPLLNTGLLTPWEVIETALAYTSANAVPINSLEGFLRQIIGWREFVRASYLLKGGLQRSSNYFQHQKKIPESFWKGAVGIPPIDTIIQRVLQTGYCNHIERLMVLGNFLLLTESSPHEVYSWFMAHFVDAYDWVMVPNIYGMGQYADGGKIVTKPYISAANYLLKMSNYPKGAWTEIWDGLFWRFLQIHHETFFSNPRTKNLIQLLKKNEATIAPKIHKAELWLANYQNK